MFRFVKWNKVCPQKRKILKTRDKRDFNKDLENRVVKPSEDFSSLNIRMSH